MTLTTKKRTAGLQLAERHREFVDESERMRSWLMRRISEEVEQWNIAQVRDMFADFYLYYTQGDIKIAQDLPGEGWKLAMTQRIHKGATREQIRRMLWDALKNCPCLPLSM